MSIISCRARGKNPGARPFKGQTVCHRRETGNHLDGKALCRVHWVIVDPCCFAAGIASSQNRTVSSSLTPDAFGPLQNAFELRGEMAQRGCARRDPVAAQ